MDNNRNHNYYNWTIKSGDYIRDPESTSTFEKRLKRNRIKVKLIKGMGIFFAALVLLFLLLRFIAR